MAGRDSGYKPTPRTRPSARDSSRARIDKAAAGSRQAAASPSVRSGAQSPASRSRTPASGARRARTTAAHPTTARSTAAHPTAARSTAARASASASLSANRTWLYLIGGVVVLAALIVAIAFAVGGKHDDPAADDVQQASADGAAQSADAAAAPSNKNPGPYSVSFTTTGDLIFWREVAEYIDMNGGASAMANIADMLSQADVTISNLESPLSDNDSEPVPDKDVYIIGRPSAIDSVVNSGIDIVSLANNHIMDYTGPALRDTLNALDAAGIQHAGAGMNEADADRMVETTVNGASIAFFSWTDIVPDNYVAFGDQPGVASARLNMDDALRRVREAKETHDVVIVAMHWGIEYQDYADEYTQREPAHKLVDAGADVILGNHPHVLQGIEFYNGSLIAYAHGNCVFRQAFEFGNTHESYVLNFNMTQDGVSDVVVTPLYLDDAYGIPSVATGDQAHVTLSRLVEISEGMNTAFDLRDGKAYVKAAS